MSLCYGWSKSVGVQNFETETREVTGCCVVDGHVQVDRCRSGVYIAYCL
jgi:hypothetical protein